MDNVEWLVYAHHDIKESMHVARRMMQETGNRLAVHTDAFGLNRHRAASWHGKVRRAFSTENLQTYAHLTDEEITEKPLVGRIGFSVFRLISIFTLSLLVMVASYWNLFLMSRSFLSPMNLLRRARRAPSSIAAVAPGTPARSVNTAALAQPKRVAGYDRAVLELLEKAKGLEAAFESQGAIACYREACELVPGNGALMSLLSKAISDQVFDDAISKNSTRAKEIAHESLAISSEAMERDPGMADGYVAHAVNLGRLAIFAGNHEKVELSRGVKESVERALAIDPSNDMALHVRARWEMEMASLGAVVRAAARIAFGGLEMGSWQHAADFLRRAVEVAPGRLPHHVELAKCLAKLGRVDEAREELKRALKMPIVDVNYELERLDGVRLLAKIGDK